MEQVVVNHKHQNEYNSWDENNVKQLHKFTDVTETIAYAQATDIINNTLPNYSYLIHSHSSCNIQVL